MADIFVSYTSSDRDWAFWIGQELEKLGHMPHVHEWQIKGGDDIYAWMEARHDASDHVLCVISDDYLKAPYSTLERNAALWQAASKRPGFVLMVAVKPCKLPTLADHLRRCELYGLSDDVARQRFRNFMTKREAPALIAFPGEAFAVSNIPIRVPTHFMGRDDSLAAIDTALKRYEGRVAITALHGLRGVGKTTLAAAYAERHRGNYRATWWIRAQTDQTMRADLVGLGVRLKWVAADEKEEPALAIVMERLRNEGDGILLIFDNAIDAGAMRPYLPRGGAAHVLLTSNAYAWRGTAEPVEIRLWPREVGADYLIARTGRETERVAAEALSVALGGLPLAHEQAAAYCERLEMPLAEYHRRFDVAPVRFLDDERHAPAEYHDGLTVAKTFALAIDEAAKLHLAAEPLIVHAALLASEPIPLYVFSEAREKFGKPLACALEGDGLLEAVAALRAFALVDREMIVDERDPTITTDCIRLHRLVRQVAAGRRENEKFEEVQRGLMDALEAIYPEDVYQNPNAWPRARRLDAITLALIDNTVAVSERLSTLLERFATYHYAVLADYSQARPILERALAMRESVLGAEHPLTAATTHNLAHLHHDLGDLERAQTLYERSLAIKEKVLGQDHPETATSLDNLALVLKDRGNLGGARPLLERALAIYERVFGEEHVDTVTSLNNLALLLWHQGDLAGARPLYERALIIGEKVFGSDHPSTANGLNNLAVLLKDQGEFDAAKPLYERAVKISEKVLGPEHPDTAMRLHNLARLLEKQGDLAEAQQLLSRALSISEKTLGQEHPQTAVCLQSLAALLRDQGNFGVAQPLFERAITIWDNAEHPYASLGRTHLARLFLATGDTTNAAALGKAALIAHDSMFGPNHVRTRESAGVTADALDASGYVEEAAALRKKYGDHRSK